MITKTDKLKSCPFCGHRTIFTAPDEIGSGGQWVAPVHVGCSRCKAEQTGDDEATARTNWSRRAALQSQDREDAEFLQEDDRHDLHRFIKTTEDGQGYDIGKDRIKRLAELGVVSSQGFGRYSVTMFGYWCHEKYRHQNPSLPLKTIDEHNADKAIDHARRIEGEGK